MNKFARLLSGMGAVCLAAFVCGCSDIEAPTGTKVEFVSISGKPMEREKVAELSRFLIRKSSSLIGIAKPRVDSITDNSLTLLLPGKKVSRKSIAKITEQSSVEFYHLKNVITKEHPNRPWRMMYRSGERDPWVFAGPDAQRIDSQQDPEDLLKDIVGLPDAKPILIGKDILPRSTSEMVRDGWAILVHFTDEGSKKFHAFTRTSPGEYVGIFYNGTLTAIARIKGEIKEGEAYLPGFRTGTEAEFVASQLNSAHIPVRIKVKSVLYY